MSTLEVQPQTPQDENPTHIVWKLAWPAVALNSLQVVNAMLDSGFIGHLPQHDLVAYGALTSFIFLLFSIAMAIGTASTALVSRAYGAGQIGELQKAARQCLGVAFFSGIVLAIVGYVLSGPAANFFLPKEEVVAHRRMVEFIAVWVIGLGPLYLIQALAGALRGVGDTKSPMIISGLQIIGHILLNFILIFPPREIGGGITIPGFNLGLVGAGAAPAIANVLAAVVYLAYTPRTSLGSCLKFEFPRLDWVRRILRIAIPAAVMALLRVGTLALSMLALKMSNNGAVALAAIRPGFGIEAIMFMPSFGLSMAAAALVGQSLGMGRPERAERLAWTAAHHAAIVTVVLSVPIFIFAPQISGLLIADKPAISAEAAVLLRALCLTEVGFAYAMVFMGAMQGAGDTKRPLWITIWCLVFLRAPLSFLLTLGLAMGPMGTWIAISLTQGVQGALSAFVFKQGRWKTEKV